VSTPGFHQFAVGLVPCMASGQSSSQGEETHGLEVFYEVEDLKRYRTRKRKQREYQASYRERSVFCNSPHLVSCRGVPDPIPVLVPGQHRRDAAWRFLSTDVREPIGKSGPGMNLHQEIRHLDQRIHISQFPLQVFGSGGHIAGEGSNDELSSVDSDAVELAIAGTVRRAASNRSRASDAPRKGR
jgi:hypothetical protein